MTPSTDVAVKDDAELAVISPEEAALIADNQANVDAADLVIPILKLAQPLTDEVATGDAKPGDFVIALTRESLGPEIEFIVSGSEKGRFKPGDKKKGTRTLVSYGEALVPWTDDPFYGQPFAEHPDAEEQYRKRVQAGEIEWESGPPIQTTYNFTGYVAGSEVPVRLSLRRTTAPAARKWNTILDAVLRGRYWDSVFALSSAQTKGDKGNYFTIDVKQARKTNADERQAAIKLALILKDSTVAVVGDEDGGGGEKSAVQPDAQGGLAV